MTIDERLEALAMRIEGLVMNAELVNREIESLKDMARQDGENIRALANCRDARPALTDLDGGPE